MESWRERDGVMREVRGDWRAEEGCRRADKWNQEGEWEAKAAR